MLYLLLFSTKILKQSVDTIILSCYYITIDQTYYSTGGVNYGISTRKIYMDKP